jgi:hypothetical protein
MLMLIGFTQCHVQFSNDRSLCHWCCTCLCFFHIHAITLVEDLKFFWCQIYACRQSAPGHPEDHTLLTVHQIMEAWLEVAQGLLEVIEENVKSSNSEAAAKSCWLVERVWKLLMSTMDLLHIMDPDDFMKLKHELAINTSSQLGVDTSVEHIGGGKCCAKDFSAVDFACVTSLLLFA